ncbi:MAG: hypothetical protein WCL10_02660 [Novosphingobium sp.]|uniref:SH3 domain-containing protein n=1 Tax=Novosphingobium sp. TaxID=1874826 RepID=UPI0030195720
MRFTLITAAFVAAAVPLAPLAAQPMQAIAASATHLLAGPLSDYPSVRTISRGAKVLVHGCLRDWSWCDVTYRSDRGWIAADTLRVNHRKRRLAVAADLGIDVTTFTFEPYWSSHYRGRRFYTQRQFWQDRYDRDYRPEWGGESPREESTSSLHRWSPGAAGPGEAGQDEGGPGQPEVMVAPYAFPEHTAEQVRSNGRKADPGGQPAGNARQDASQDRGQAARNPDH